MSAAVAAIITLTTVNVIGTRFGGRVQVVGTALKVGALVTMIVLPFFLGQVNPGLLTPIAPKNDDANLLPGIMLAMISILWTYDGWVNAASLAEDIKDPGKNIPRALILGMFALIAIYLGMTLDLSYGPANRDDPGRPRDRVGEFHEGVDRFSRSDLDLGRDHGLDLYHPQW